MKRVRYIVLFAIMLIGFNEPVFADPWASINANNSVTQGSSIKVTGTIASNSSLFFIEGSIKCTGAGVNKSADINLETMDNNKKSQSASLTITPSSTGTVTCTVSGRASGAEGSQWKSVSTSKKITVNKPREKSANNNLKGLKIEGYSVTPEFNKDTLEYSSEIPSSVEKINIQADKEDGYASVDGAGEREVKEGLNKFEIKVTSETGSEKVYVLNVNLVDNNPIEKTVDGKKYTVVKRASSLTLPEGIDKEKFTNSTVKMNELDIPVYTSEELKLTLIGLKDEKGNIYLYKYEDEKITDMYETITSKALSILIENPKEELEGYTKTTVTINNKEYTAYQNKYKDYALVYGTNLETNESNWYLYNIKENTLQTYMKDMIDGMNDNFTKELDQYKLVIMCLGGLSLFLLLIIVIMALKKGKKKNIKTLPEKTKLEDTEEIDKTEIIINKVEEKKEKVEEPKKKEKKKNKKESEFLNDEDIKEILSNQNDDEMDMEFFDDYKKRKKRK